MLCLNKRDEVSKDMRNRFKSPPPFYLPSPVGGTGMIKMTEMS